MLDTARRWYTYPLEHLATAPPECYAIAPYDDLVADTEQTVRRVYERLGLQVGPRFAQVLRDEAKPGRDYVSRHHYSLESIGLEPEQLVGTFRDTFEQFGFDMRGASP